MKPNSLRTTIARAEQTLAGAGVASPGVDARLLAAVDLGGVRLTDNVGLPLGVGFKHVEA